MGRNCDRHELPGNLSGPRQRGWPSEGQARTLGRVAGKGRRDGEASSDASLELALLGRDRRQIASFCSLFVPQALLSLLSYQYQMVRYSLEKQAWDTT